MYDLQSPSVPGFYISGFNQLQIKLVENEDTESADAEPVIWRLYKMGMPKGLEQWRILVFAGSPEPVP